MLAVFPLLALVHILAGLLAVALAITVFCLAKGDRRHRLFGWCYVVLMLTSLAAILIRGVSQPKPFHGYALIVAAGLVAAVFASRLRDRIAAWRTWHALLMSFSTLAAIVAIGGVIGGAVLGVGKGPAYYRMFNCVIAVITLAGLWVINTRSVIWRPPSIGPDRTARLWFNFTAVGMSAALVIGQWLVFT
jgi:uncharacterized membrane protein